MCSFILVVVWVGPDVEEISDAHAFPGAVPPEEPRSSKALVTRVCCLACAFAIIPALGTLGLTLDQQGSICQGRTVVVVVQK